MIMFKDATTSQSITILTLTLIFLIFIVSLFLNPAVFLYNYKKTSVAGTLFCIIAAADFIICLMAPIKIIYNGAVIRQRLEKASCFNGIMERKPQTKEVALFVN